MYYKPDYFLLENVVGILGLSDSTAVKMIMKVAVKMEYQVRIGLLQAGHYGVRDLDLSQIVLMIFRFLKTEYA
jgi:site-specific DNA-cytosine methylase